MNYEKITEAYGNLVKVIKEEGMDVTDSNIKIKENGGRRVFIRIRANKNKAYKLKDD